MAKIANYAPYPRKKLEFLSQILLPYGTQVGLGDIDGWSNVFKFGRNPDIDIATAPQDVWEGGGLYTGQPDSAPETVEVFSDSAADAAAGTGARTIRIFGLKTSDSTSYESEDFTLDGTTPVVSTESWWRVNRAYVLTSGSGQTNAGLITVRHSTTTANVFVQMAAGTAQTQIAAWTVPAGHQFAIVDAEVSLVRANGANGSGLVELATKDFGTNTWRFQRLSEISNSQNTSLAIPSQPLIVSPKADIVVRVTSVSDNNSIVGASIAGFLIEND